MSVYFSSGRSILSENDWCFTVNPSTGNLSAGNYYFTIQGRNRIGLNKPLKSNLITIPSNSTLTITLNSSIYKSGENWFDFVISISQVDDINYFKQFLVVNIKKTDNYSSLDFPIDVVLNKDADLEVEKEYCNPNDIDDTDFLNGKVIKCSDTNYFYEFYKDEYIPEDEINTANFNTDLGCFKRIFTSNRNITNVENYGGCNLYIRSDLARLDYYRPITYFINNVDSEYLKFTVANNTVNSFLKNSVVNILTFVNNQNGGAYLENSIYVIFRGFVNLTTGELRTLDADNNEITTLNIPYIFNVTSPNLYLPDTLNPNEGLILDIYIRLNPVILSNIFTNNSKVLIYPIIYNSFIKYSPFYEIFTKGVRVNSLDSCFLDPQLDGTIILKKGEIIFKGYSIFRNYNETISLSQNTQQFININIENQLNVLLPNDELPPDSVNLAQINCVAGTSIISNKIKINLTTTGSLNFKLTLPSVIDNQIKIRTSYSNPHIRNEYITFPTIDLIIYIKKSDETIIQVPYVIETVEEQNISLNILPTTEIAVEDINFITPFGLIDPPYLTANTNSSGLIPSGEYEIFCSFVYQGVEITDILQTLPLFDLDKLGGNGNAEITYGLTKLDSEPNLILNLQESLNYEITLLDDCVLESPIFYQVGSTINLILKQDEVGRHLVTFGENWKFVHSNSKVSLSANAVSHLKGFVTDDGIIYCSILAPYFFTRNPAFGNDFQLNNFTPLLNDLNGFLNESGKLLNESQLRNANKLTN